MFQAFNIYQLPNKKMEKKKKTGLKLNVDVNVEIQFVFTQTKSSQTHTPTQTQQPLRCQIPCSKPNLEIRCQYLALKENQKH